MIVGAALASSGAAAAQVPDQVALRGDAVPMTVARAKALTPQALGDALLAPGHPPVVLAHVGPRGLAPPPPPGAPVATPIRLVLRGIPSAQPGFCQQTVASIDLKPVGRLADGSLPAAAADTLATHVQYRWRGDVDCAAPADAFFVPRDGEAMRDFAIVRLLAKAQQAARRGGRPGFPVSVTDKMGPELIAYQRSNPTQPPVAGLTVVTDARKALAMLPIEEIGFVGRSTTAFPDSLRPSDTDAATRADATTIFMGGVWTVGLVLERGRIVRMRLRREIPPPF